MTFGAEYFLNSHLNFLSACNFKNFLRESLYVQTKKIVKAQSDKNSKTTLKKNLSYFDKRRFYEPGKNTDGDAKFTAILN